MFEKVPSRRSFILFTLETSEQHVSKSWVDIFRNFGRAFSASNLRRNEKKKKSLGEAKYQY